MPEYMKANDLLPLATEVVAAKLLERQYAIVGSGLVDPERLPSAQ
jgi:hypothetical protein